MKFSKMVDHSLKVTPLSESNKTAPVDPQALAWWMDKQGYNPRIQEAIKVSHPTKGKATVLEVNTLGVTVKWQNPLQAITGTELIEFRDVHFLNVMNEEYSDDPDDVTVDLDDSEVKKEDFKHKSMRVNKKTESRKMRNTKKLDESVVGMAAIGGMGVGYTTGRKKEFNFDLTAEDLGLINEQSWDADIELAPAASDTTLTNNDKSSKSSADPLSSMAGADSSDAKKWDGTQMIDEPADSPAIPSVLAQDAVGTGVPSTSKKKSSGAKKTTTKKDAPKKAAPKKDTDESKGKAKKGGSFNADQFKKKDSGDDVTEDVSMTAADLGLIREMDNAEDNYNFEGYGRNEFGDDVYLDELYLNPRDLEKLRRYLNIDRNETQFSKKAIDAAIHALDIDQPMEKPMMRGNMSEDEGNSVGGDISLTVDLLKSLLQSVASQSPDASKIDALASGLVSASSGSTLDVSDMEAIKSAVASAYTGVAPATDDGDDIDDSFDYEDGDMGDEEGFDDVDDSDQDDSDSDDAEFEDKAAGDGEEAGEEAGEEHKGKTKMMDCDMDDEEEKELTESRNASRSRKTLKEEFVGMATFPSTFISSFEHQAGAPVIAEDDPKADLKKMRRSAGIKNWWKI